MCFWCKLPGHNANVCPKLNQKEPQRKGNSRAFAMTQNEAEDAPDVMAGMLAVSTIPALVLFDSGATHFFISKKFLAKSRNVCDKVDNALEVSIPSGKIVRTDRMAKDVSLEICSKNIRADLYLMDMRDFDVILGMDWLSKNHANIRCRQREITFKIPGEDEFTFHGAKVKKFPRVISVMKAMKMLKKDNCQGFLVNIMGTQPKEVKFGDVPIVREYGEM